MFALIGMLVVLFFCWIAFVMFCGTCVAVTAVAVNSLDKNRVFIENKQMNPYISDPMNFGVKKIKKVKKDPFAYLNDPQYETVD
jgi:hypothetical protein